MEEVEEAEGLLEPKPFLCRVDDEVVLTGQRNAHGHIEWDWARVSAALGLGSEKDFLLLRRNSEEFKAEFQQAQCSFDEFHYRGMDQGRGKVGLHTMESRALFLMLSLFPLRRQTKAASKEMSLKLLGTLVGKAMQGSHNLLVVQFAMDGQAYAKPIRFEDGVTHDLADLLGRNREAVVKWKALASKAWCKHKLSSNFDQTGVVDLLVWLMYIKGIKTTSSLWNQVGQEFWPKMIFMLGAGLDQYAEKMAEKDPEAAPLLKTKKGNSKRVPYINKLALLKRLRKNKSHRKVIMMSHSDTVPSAAEIVLHEPLLECTQYLQLLKETFEHCVHFQISWDPSTYSGDDVMVCALWSNDCDKAGFLPIQYLMPLRTNELDDEFKALAQRKSITRVDGFAELRAVAHALASIGKDLPVFEIREDVFWRPVKADERRVFSGGKHWIVNNTSGVPGQHKRPRGHQPWCP